MAGVVGPEVIAKAVEALLHVPYQDKDSVLTFDNVMEAKGKNQAFNARKLDLKAFHQLSSVKGVIGNFQSPNSASLRSGKDMEIEIMILTGKTIKIKCKSTTTIDHLKTEIYGLEGIPPDQQRLIFGVRQIDDGTKTLADCGIIHQSTIHLVPRLRGGGVAPQYRLSNDLRCPDYDFDFTGVVDTETFWRGHYPYGRPCGWTRIALNVLDKYENNVWIGAHRERTTATSSVDGEWLVSYHGTGLRNSRSIAADGYLLSKGRRFLHGTGIYSTPDIHIAEFYAKKFTYGTKQFLVVVQNRVNPNSLVEIPMADTYPDYSYWLTPTQEDIRPYGICIKPFNWPQTTG